MKRHYIILIIDSPRDLLIRTPDDITEELYHSMDNDGQPAAKVKKIMSWPEVEG